MIFQIKTSVAGVTGVGFYLETSSQDFTGVIASQ